MVVSFLINMEKEENMQEQIAIALGLHKDGKSNTYGVSNEMPSWSQIFVEIGRLKERAEKREVEFSPKSHTIDDQNRESPLDPYPFTCTDNPYCPTFCHNHA